jgi:glycosyltransferase involved in cell wall biosynthesis
MKVLAISHSSVVDIYRERYEALSKADGIDELVIVCPTWWMENLKILKSNAAPENSGYRLVRLKPLAWGFRRQPYMNTCHLYPGIRGLLKEEKPDIVDIIEEPYSLVTAQTLYHARNLPRRPATVFFSAQNIHRNYPPPFRWTEKYVLTKSTGAHPINTEVLEVLRKKGFEGPSTIIPLGVNSNTYSPDNRDIALVKLGVKSPVVLFMGRLVPEKGYDDLIDAAFKSDEKFSLVIVGGGPDEERVKERLSELSTKRPTLLTGRIPHEEAAVILSAADIVVVPSRTTTWWKEQFGRVIVEAQCAGAVVIGSDSGEIPQVINDSGLIFKEGDISELQHHIDSLLTTPEMFADYKNRGMAQSKTLYTWEAIADKTALSYRKLIEIQRNNPQ